MSERMFTYQDLLGCYRRGIFPMAEARDDPTVFFVEPDMRGIIPLDGLKVSKSLRKTIRQNTFTVTFDTCFARVIGECAAPTADRPDTWINDGIEYLYGQLHENGFAHSVEVWKGDELVGGLYGVSIGAAFFGESMFSRMSDASKVALVYLVERLTAGGYELLDTQFINPHLERMGAIEISRADYQKRLEEAVVKSARFSL